MAALGAGALLLGGLSSTASAQSVQLVPFGGQDFDLPYYVTAPPDDPSRVFIVEGRGVIRLVKDGVTQATPFLDISGRVVANTTACGECGMYSMAFAPNYERSGRFYVFYTADRGITGRDLLLRLQEFRRSASNPDVARASSGRVVLTIPRGTRAHHNGGQLQFGPDRKLYISVGDGARKAAAQSLASRNGKLLRINPRASDTASYTIPPGNPFADGPDGNADEIYASGFRNPFHFSFDLATGDLAIGDVGAEAWEEVDFAERGDARGANFGWPCFEGAHPGPQTCTPPPVATDPVLEYAHPEPGLSAVMGGYVVRDGALPSLVGRYVFADGFTTFGGELQVATLAEGGATDQAGLGVSADEVVSFGEDACGHIYVAEFGGTVSRLEPTSGTFTCDPQTSSTVTSPPPLEP